MTAPAILTSPIVVRRATAADVSAAVDLHRRGFASQWTGREWRHRYAQGNGVVVGAFLADGRCVAAFGGVLLDARLQGRSLRVCRGGDVVVDPGLRATAAGPRVLLRVCRAFLDELAACGAAFVFGFPQPALQRTLQRHCGYQVLPPVRWLALAVASEPAGAHAAPAPCLPRLPADADRLLASLGALAPSALVRDARYLRWRYEQDPAGAHRFVVVRSPAGELRALAVVRSGPLHDGALICNEWLVHVEDGASRAALRAGVAAAARAVGAAHVASCASASSPWSDELRHEGFVPATTSHQLTFHALDAALAPVLAAEWRFTPGDLDFT